MRRERRGAGADGDAVDFGELPDGVNEILQRGVVLHRTDRAAADAAFRAALALEPTALATWFCLYKIHTYSGDLDAALAAAEGGLVQAARAADLGPDPATWVPGEVSLDGPGRFALYTLKALAFIRLRRGEPEAAAEALALLAHHDPGDAVGGSVVSDVAEAIDRAP